MGGDGELENHVVVGIPQARPPQKVYRLNVAFARDESQKRHRFCRRNARRPVFQAQPARVPRPNAYIRKLNVCQRSRSSQPPTVRLPTSMRAVPRMPGVSTASVSSSVIIAS